MRIGRLNKRVTIQSPNEFKNDLGEVETEYEDYATKWAAVEPLIGKEYMAAAQINSDITTKVVVRYDNGITAKMRVLYTRSSGDVAEAYEVSSVIHVREGRRETVMMCRTISGEGIVTRSSSGQ